MKLVNPFISSIKELEFQVIYMKLNNPFISRIKELEFQVI